jgi:hypothetical protein
LTEPNDPPNTSAIGYGPILIVVVELRKEVSRKEACTTHASSSLDGHAFIKFRIIGLNTGLS